MSDSTDNIIIQQSINGDLLFQERCRFRFINAAISVTTESTNTASHAQRLAFAGALFAGTVDPVMLTMVVLANPTNRTNCLANPTIGGGNILDNDIDFQIASTFTGIAISRAW